jgi:ABC-2 type transport system permease protein
MVVVNGTMLIMALTSGSPPFHFMYGIFGGTFVAFGVMIIMQRAIVGEKRDGTAAWLLSKPVTRTAFVVSRMIGNMLGILVTSTLVPGLIVYITAGLLTPLGWLPPLDFFAGVLAYALHVFFWLTLTLKMGTFFESITGVIAVPMIIFFGLWLLPRQIPGFDYLHQVSPLSLTSAEASVMTAIGPALMSGTPVVTWLPAIVAAVLCVVFVAVAIWRFNRQEF